MPYPTRHTKILSGLSFLVPEQLRKTFVKPLQYLNVRKVLLCKPGRGHDAQLCLDGAEALWSVADDHDRLLYRTPSYVGWSVDQLARIKLPCARYAEE
jgi:hypothetical protein